MLRCYVFVIVNTHNNTLLVPLKLLLIPVSLRVLVASYDMMPVSTPIQHT